jgi:hypothetical protein
VYECPETRHYYTEGQKKEGEKMAKQKQHVFSARTTEEGLRRLNELKTRLGVSWDELVIDAVCAHYGLDRAAMALLRKEKAARGPEKADRPAEAQADGEEPTGKAAEQKKAGARKKGKGAAASLKAKNAEAKA